MSLSPNGTVSHDSLRALDYSYLQQCMHCGFCLPTCPTYDLTRQERHSPHGRIALMRAIADNRMEATKVFGEEMYYCLGCLACMTACPAGVNYAVLFETARAEAEHSGKLRNSVRDRTRGVLLNGLFTRPRLFRFLCRFIWLYQATGLQMLVRRLGLTRLFSKRMQELESQTPAIRPRFSHQLMQSTERPENGNIKYRVGLLTGCIQDLAFSDVNRDTADVLLANGCEVYTPPIQYCCGSLHSHNGEPELARILARRNLDLFDLSKLDAVITNAAGCGSHLKAYGHLLAGDPVYGQRAAEWSRRVKDISEWLVEIGLRRPNEANNPVAISLTYHEACHLCHGQKISSQPRAVLAAVPGANLTELNESTWCCGSAGIYNITQPETSLQLLDRKMANIVSTKVTAVAVANPGCHMQLVRGIKQRDLSINVVHPISLLAAAYRAER